MGIKKIRFEEERKSKVKGNKVKEKRKVVRKEIKVKRK